MFYLDHRYGCLSFNAWKTELYPQEKALFIRTIDMVVLRLMLGTQNMTYRRRHILLAPQICLCVRFNAGNMEEEYTNVVLRHLNLMHLC
jgi:hypothetical protein